MLTFPINFLFKKHDGSTNPVKDEYTREAIGHHKCESLASEFMLWTYSVWVHLGSCGLLWAHLGSGSSERIYLPGQGRLESKIALKIYFLKHFEHSFGRGLAARSGPRQSGV